MKKNDLLVSWSARDRKDSIRKLSETTFDVLVVGGGITGAGILRACGLRGIRAALIDKEDFAFGTSSKSTKLAHGGVRYIANGEFGLVSEACHERDWLRGAFPNLVRPMPNIAINFSALESRLKGAYLHFYDILAGWGNYKNYRHLKKTEVERREPNIRLTGMHSGALIYECILNDARLTMEIVKEGVRLGGMAVNYVSARKPVEKEGRVVGVEVEDRLTGDALRITAKSIVNACGVWADDFMPAGASPIIRPTKGVHLVVRREDVGNMSGLMLKMPRGLRGVFMLAHGDFTYIGTTDTDYNGDLDHCYTDRDDYEYLREITDFFFRSANFTEKTLVGSYAGSRPLVKQEGVSETKTSRREFIIEIMPGLFLMTGGKLTIFRSMAEKLLHFIADRGALTLSRKDRNLSRSPFTLGIEKDAWEALVPATRLSASVTEHLYQCYGRGALSIIEAVGKDSSLGEQITPGQPNIWGELPYALEYEMVVHLKDFLLRRTNLSLHQRDDHEGLGDATARRMATYLGWDKKRITQEVSDYVSLAHNNRFFLEKKKR
jgi:glycerol-3-phosphate dehydrogenase